MEANDKLEENVKQRVIAFRDSNLALLHQIKENCIQTRKVVKNENTNQNVETTDNENNMKTETFIALDDKSILQCKVIEIIDVCDNNYSLNLDDEFENVGNIGGTNFRNEKKVSPTKTKLYRKNGQHINCKIDNMNQNDSAGIKESTEVENIFEKHLACMEIPLIQKYYPFVKLTLSMNDFQFFDTVYQIFLKPTPSKIINSIFNRASTIQNMLTRHFLFQNAIQNFSDFASKQSSNNSNGNIFVSTKNNAVIDHENKTIDNDSMKNQELKEEKSTNNTQLDMVTTSIIGYYYFYNI